MHEASTVELKVEGLAAPPASAALGPIQTLLHVAGGRTTTDGQRYRRLRLSVLRVAPQTSFSIISSLPHSSESIQVDVRGTCSLWSSISLLRQLILRRSSMLARTRSRVSQELHFLFRSRLRRPIDEDLIKFGWDEDVWWVVAESHHLAPD